MRVLCSSGCGRCVTRYTMQKHTTWKIRAQQGRGVLAPVVSRRQTRRAVGMRSGCSGWIRDCSCRFRATSPPQRPTVTNNHDRRGGWQRSSQSEQQTPRLSLLLSVYYSIRPGHTCIDIEHAVPVLLSMYVFLCVPPPPPPRAP